ncbi:hypothetical protein [Heminiphilus faecis]|jgi:hypothetical protein|uniref:hypothetical protein n=1 Tax=Heminiphilus faecis TaxID=2601703 RepID=UPI001966D513|nr:hypothetical protein [Heminiphilus faecis]
MTHHEKSSQITPPLSVGALIFNELKRQGHSASWLAEKIHCDRTNIYKICSRNAIDCELLCRISIALNYDFFRYFSIRCGFIGPDEEPEDGEKGVM